MVNAEFFRRDGSLVGFKVSGHADFAEYGEDIVCASVSSAVQLVCNTLTECFHSDAKVSVDESNGIALRLVSTSPEDPCTKVLDGLKLHLEVLSEDYPKRINITEV